MSYAVSPQRTRTFEVLVAMSGNASATGQPTPEQMAQMQAQIAAEARKRGLTPQQFQAQQRQQIEADAKKAGMTFEEYVNHIRKQAYEQHQRQQQMAQQQANQPQQGQQVPINPGPPDPKAVAVAKWLQSQDLKTRTSILNGQRKVMFKGKPPIYLSRSDPMNL